MGEGFEGSAFAALETLPLNPRAKSTAARSCRLRRVVAPLSRRKGGDGRGDVGEVFWPRLPRTSPAKPERFIAVPQRPSGNQNGPLQFSNGPPETRMARCSSPTALRKPEWPVEALQRPSRKPEWPVRVLQRPIGNQNGPLGFSNGAPENSNGPFGFHNGPPEMTMARLLLPTARSGSTTAHRKRQRPVCIPQRPVGAP
jgi:hypothetical protein